LGNIQAGAFTVNQTSGASTFSLAAPTIVSQTANSTEIELTFQGASILNGSLADGRYQLVIDGAKITDSNGIAVDADGTGQPGGILSSNFHRFFGDSDGDGDVDARDAGNYRAGLRGNATWRSVFDFDNDGMLLNGAAQDQEDRDAFFANFGKRVSSL
jgi:hypothetical protein